MIHSSDLDDNQFSNSRFSYIITPRSTTPQDKLGEFSAGDNNATNTSFLSWQVFSIPYSLLKWVLGFRWYVILVVGIITLYIIFQLQYAFENRRKKYNNAKESMVNNTTSKESIMQNKYDRNKKTKHVSFSDEYEPEAFTNNNTAEKESFFVTLKRSIAQIYKSWILPWIYMLFKTNGFAR